MPDVFEKDLIEDWDWCRYCGEDTWHIFTDNGPECEYCVLDAF